MSSEQCQGTTWFLIISVCRNYGCFKMSQFRSQSQFIRSDVVRQICQQSQSEYCRSRMCRSQQLFQPQFNSTVVPLYLRYRYRRQSVVVLGRTTQQLLCYHGNVQGYWCYSQCIHSGIRFLFTRIPNVRVVSCTRIFG